MKYIFAILIGAALFGCSDERAESGPVSGSLAVAVLPDQSIEALNARHGPLIDYLEKTTSFDIELVIPLDYADLLDKFDNGSINLAWFGGVTFTQAEARSQADPLVLRDIDLEFTSCYLTSASENRSTIREFEGEDFAFGPELSTSGHLMPRYFLEGQGLYAEQFFASTRHTAGHDQTARLVSDGIIELGVANCVIVQSLLENNVLDPGDVRIIETTPPYSDYVWATNASMHEQTRALLLDAFLALDASDPQHRAILRSQGANAYMPAASGDFTLVRKAVRLHGLQTDSGER
jgi:phosphonate transport system substrate-binding protein